MRYPPAERHAVADILHGRVVEDPYRWLEDPSAPETRAWSEAQDALARPFLEALPGRDAMADRLEELLQVGMVGLPVHAGERTFFLRRNPDQDMAVLFVREPDGSERTLLDPVALDPTGTTTLDTWMPSWEGHRLAYQLSVGGDEESSLFVLDVESGSLLDGPIDRCRYSTVSWLPGGDAFYYSRRLHPSLVPVDESQYHRRVWLHRIGTDADAEDVVVFGEGRDKTDYVGGFVSDDGRWLVVSASQGTAPRNDVFIADLAGDGELRPLQVGVDAQLSPMVAFDGLLYLWTTRGAPHHRLLVTSPERIEPEHWRELLPETDAVLASFAVTETAVVAVRHKDARSILSVHDRTTGDHLRDVELPGLGTVGGLTARREGGDEVWFDYTDFATPGRVYRYVVSEDRLELWAAPPGSLPTPAVVSRQVFYESRDGTRVPMFVLHRPDVELDGARPTILTGYGGFNAPNMPAYNASALAWVEGGGVFASACLRGGSEYGEEWHRAGRREHKQNVFDDFLAAAEWLVAEDYTSPEHLGIMGGSNGGLLVGAAMTQRPDLFAAVVCSAPLLDMVRYELFGLGATWNDEYGRADVPEELEWLYSYSPYHRVVPGTHYPAVLMVLFDSDTRVDPMHGRKTVAALQAATASDRPIVLRREQNVGHGARSVSREVGVATDKLAFLADALGLKVA